MTNVSFLEDHDLISAVEIFLGPDQQETIIEKICIDLYIDYIKLLNYPLIRLLKISKAINIIIKNEKYWINWMWKYCRDIF